MSLAGKNLQRKLRNEEYAQHLAHLSGASSVTLGVFDGASGFFLETWTGTAEVHERTCGIDRLALTRMMRNRLSAAAEHGAPAETDGLQQLRDGRTVVGIGWNRGHLWPVIAVLTPSEAEDTKLRSLLALGLSFTDQQVAELAACGSTRNETAGDESVQEVALRMLSVHFAVVNADGVIDYSVNLSPDWLHQHGGFKICDKHLVARSQKVQNAFAEALKRAAGDQPKSSIVAVRDDPSSARLVWISPLEDLHPARVLVILEQGSEYLAMRENLLQLAGLTQSERRVAHRVLLGKSLPEVAEETGLAVSTVRSYMKSIFHKTNTRRQSEFVSRYQSALLRMRLGAGDPHVPKT